MALQIISHQEEARRVNVDMIHTWGVGGSALGLAQLSCTESLSSCHVSMLFWCRVFVCVCKR